MLTNPHLLRLALQHFGLLDCRFHKKVIDLACFGVGAGSTASDEKLSIFCHFEIFWFVVWLFLVGGWTLLQELWSAGNSLETYGVFQAALCLLAASLARFVCSSVCSLHTAWWTTSHIYHNKLIFGLRADSKERDCVIGAEIDSIHTKAWAEDTFHKHWLSDILIWCKQCWLFDQFSQSQCHFQHHLEHRCCCLCHIPLCNLHILVGCHLDSYTKFHCPFHCQPNFHEYSQQPHRQFELVEGRVRMNATSTIKQFCLTKRIRVSLAMYGLEYFCLIFST